jgi:hypothetical protein
MKEKKEKFIEALFEFYVMQMDNPDGISGMHYKRAEDGGEWVVVDMAGGKKEFPIHGRNIRGIFLDFANFLKKKDEFRWLRPNYEIKERED